MRDVSTPLQQLARILTAYTGHADTARAVAAAGVPGPWTLAASCGWPAYLRPSNGRGAAASQPSIWWNRLLAKLRALFVRPPPPPTARELEAATLDAHSWLCRLAIERIRQHLPPTAAAVAVDLARVTAQGLNLTLAASAWVMDRNRDPGKVRAPHLPALGAGASAADLLVAHIAIEQAIVGLAGRIDENVLHVRKTVARPPGGLRRAEFLDAFVALSLGDPSVLAMARTLIAHSPLTRWVYFDVVEGPRTESDSEPVADLTPGQLAPLWTGLVAADTDGAGPVVVWSQYWLSILARSLLGALLAPVGSLERSYRDHVSARRRPREPFLAACKRVPLDDVLGARAADLTAERVHRIQVLAAMFRRDSSVPPAPGALVHVLLLDMLVRGLAAEHAAAGLRRWHEDRRAARHVDEGVVAYGAGSQVASALTQILRGPIRAGESVPGHLANAMAEFLEPDCNFDAAAIAEATRQTGIDPLVIRTWLARYTDAAAYPLPASTGAFRESLRASRDVLADWLEETLDARDHAGGEVVSAAAGIDAATTTERDEANAP